MEEDLIERDILPETESDWFENGTLVLRLVSAPLLVSRLDLSRLSCRLLLSEFEVVFTSVELEDAGEKVRRVSSL